MHRSVIARVPLSLAALLCASTLTAQKVRATSFVDDCSHNNNGGRDEVVCETRAVSLAPSAGLRVDGRQNGGITVHAWNNPQFQIVAMVQARAESQAEAQAIARAVSIAASNGEITSDGPKMDGNNHQSWSVSFEVWAPRATALSLVAMNGGIAVDGIQSQMTIETMNGGLTLTDVDGDVHATTMNGGINVELTGDRYRGAGLDLKTMNGGIKLMMPSAYSAQLETSTVNGSLDLGFPVTVSGINGRMDRKMSAMLGSGGATIRAVTTNGGVSIQRK